MIVETMGQDDERQAHQARIPVGNGNRVNVVMSSQIERARGKGRTVTAFTLTFDEYTRLAREVSGFANHIVNGSPLPRTFEGVPVYREDIKFR